MGNVWGLNNSGGKSSKMGAGPCVSGWMIEFIGLQFPHWEDGCWQRWQLILLLVLRFQVPAWSEDASCWASQNLLWATESCYYGSKELLWISEPWVMLIICKKNWFANVFQCKKGGKEGRNKLNIYYHLISPSFMFFLSTHLSHPTPADLKH